MKFATRAIHAGQETDPVTGAVIIPVHLSTSYAREEVEKPREYEYTRLGNPTRSALEECLASLEEGDHGLAFASGMAAVNAVLSLLSPGDHIVACEDLYGGTYRLLEQYYRKRQIGITYARGTSPTAFEEAMTARTKIVWIETPTNPLLQIIDIAALAGLCSARGAFLAVDNTFATPCLQRPLTLGAHAVVHSTTKYLNGHSDVLGGAVITKDRTIFKALKFYQGAAGAVLSPLDSWLTLRGVKTLAVRMKAHEENALRVAEFLQAHPKVASVRYPGLPDHPQHELARRQMNGFGAMVTFRLRGGRDEANNFFRNLRLFSLAQSLGGVESLTSYPTTMTHGVIPQEERERRGITEGTIRISVGIEDGDDLIEDLGHALKSSAGDRGPWTE